MAPGLSGRRTSALGLGVLLGLGCVALLAVVVGTVFLVPFAFRGDEGTSARAGGGRTVLLIAVDDLRRDHLAFHGYRYDPTPELSRLAREGVFARDFVPASTATGPSLAALLTGLGPLGTGFTSARQLGAHRLPRAVPTLAEDFSEAGWRTGAAFALPQDDDRLSGLGRGFGDVLQAALDGPPLAAPAALAGLVEIVKAAGPGADVFAFAHLADLRADWEPVLDEHEDARLVRWIARHFAPLRATDPEIARELDRLEETVGASLGDIAALVGRRRGSPAWLALQEARYDARLEALDAALADLLRGLADLGREAPLVVVAGTRGRLLGVEPPADGPPIALSEALLATALVLEPGGFRGGSDDAAWARVDRPEILASLLRAVVLAGEAADGSEPVEPRGVVAPAAASVAIVGDVRKFVMTWDGGGGWYERAADLPIPILDVEEVPLLPVLQATWDLALSPPAGGELALRFGSAAGAIQKLIGSEAEIVAPPSGKSADARVRHAAELHLLSANGHEAFTLTLSGAAGRCEIAVAGPGERGAAEPLVSYLVPVFPARPVAAGGAGEADQGVEPSGAALALEAEGAWTRVRVSGSGSVELALWLSPPNGTAQMPAVEVVHDGGGNARVETFPGLDAALVRGTAPLELRIRRGGGQTVAVAATLDGRVIRPGEMSSDKGGDPAALALYLPPVDVGAFDVRLPNGDTVLRARGRAVGLPLEPPYALTEKDARFLLRLGPLE